MKKPDNRVRPQLSLPKSKYNSVSVQLDEDDYRKWYEIVMTSGTSGAECFRQIIRQLYEGLEK